jgi:hypothetical protein
MELRSFLTFDAPGDIPATGDESPAGRDLAVSLAQGVSRRGMKIVEAVAQHDSYGWSFVVAGEEKQPVWCMLQLSDTWLVITKGATPLFKRLLGRNVCRQAHRRVCEALHAATTERPGVSSVRWFTEREFQSEGVGAEHP